MTPATFRALIWKHYRTYGRHTLPWRITSDPYRILVSEVMLQQTQVERVVPYYRAWLKKFPTLRTLAEAPLSQVLAAWQGLGYNRRAKGLWETARATQKLYAGKLPKTPEELEKLPGIGPYTARAVSAFAYNQDVTFIETNIRTVIIHHFFNDTATVSDKEIQTVLEKVFPKGKSREWYAALMDYGAHLKRGGLKLNNKTKGYTKQSAFKGSAREARGAVLRALVGGGKEGTLLSLVLGEERKEQVEQQIAKLHTEKLIEKKGKRYRLPN
jgi:A/G-specific adenine glycosylase